MTSLILRFLALCSLTLAVACDKAPPSPTQEQGGPALWQVERGALKGWLFGTIHVLPTGEYVTGVFGEMVPTELPVTLCGA